MESVREIAFLLAEVNEQLFGRVVALPGKRCESTPKFKRFLRVFIMDSLKIPIFRIHDQSYRSIIFCIDLHVLAKLARRYGTAQPH